MADKNLNNGMLLVKSNLQFDLSIFEVIDGKVNLTKICQHFGKRLDVWLKTKSTQRFLDAYMLTPNGGSIISSTSNGQEKGTFGDRKIALKLAEWISVDFEIWANDKLDTLLRTGKFELQKPQTTLDLLKLAVSELEASQKQILTLNTELTYKNDIIHDIAETVPPKTMRSTINQIIRNHSKDYQKSWTNLYKEFKYIFHKDLPVLYENAVARCEIGKSKNILDYAERFDYLTDLYKLAIKLFEDRPSFSKLAINDNLSML